MAYPKANVTTIVPIATRTRRQRRLPIGRRGVTDNRLELPSHLQIAADATHIGTAGSRANDAR